MDDDVASGYVKSSIEGWEGLNHLDVSDLHLLEGSGYSKHLQSLIIERDPDNFPCHISFDESLRLDYLRIYPEEWMSLFCQLRSGERPLVEHVEQLDLNRMSGVAYCLKGLGDYPFCISKHVHINLGRSMGYGRPTEYESLPLLEEEVEILSSMEFPQANGICETTELSGSRILCDDFLRAIRLGCHSIRINLKGPSSVFQRRYSEKYRKRLAVLDAGDQQHRIFVNLVECWNTKVPGDNFVRDLGDFLLDLTKKGNFQIYLCGMGIVTEDPLWEYIFEEDQGPDLSGLKGHLTRISLKELELWKER
jgi:hypothetical protein